MVRLTCNATRDDVQILAWQVRIGGVRVIETFAFILIQHNISLTGDMTTLSLLEIVGTQGNSGSVCTCVVRLRQVGSVPCTSEAITVEFYGMYVHYL